MGAFIKPSFRVTLNNSHEHKLFIESMNITDYESGNIDCISLRLSPNSILPNFGDRIEVFLGRDDFHFFGSFYVSAIKEQYKRGYDIEAISINYKKGMKISKNRSFENTTIGDVIRAIARENGLKTRIDFEKEKTIEVIEQSQSDLALCDNLAKRYGCTFKIKNDTLIFIDIDKDFDRREYNINADEAIELNIETFGHKNFNSVEVHFTDSLNETHIIKVGDKEPTHKVSRNFKSQTEALQYAQTYLKKTKEQKVNGELKIIGGVFFAGAFLNLTLRAKETKYLIKEVRHNINSKTWETIIVFE